MFRGCMNNKMFIELAKMQLKFEKIFNVKSLSPLAKEEIRKKFRFQCSETRRDDESRRKKRRASPNECMEHLMQWLRHEMTLKVCFIVKLSMMMMKSHCDS